jgi:hypothetical protein
MQTILIWTIWRISKNYPNHGNQLQKHTTIISKKRNIWISMWFLRKRRVQVSSTFFASEICELEPQSHLPEFCWKVREGMGGMAANLSPSSSFLEWSAAGLRYQGQRPKTVDATTANMYVYACFLITILTSFQNLYCVSSCHCFLWTTCYAFPKSGMYFVSELAQSHTIMDNLLSGNHQTYPYHLIFLFQFYPFCSQVFVTVICSLDIYSVQAMLSNTHLWNNA